MIDNTPSPEADNEPGKFHRNNSFTEFYWDVPDSVTGKSSFVGRKHDDLGWEIATTLNKRTGQKIYNTTTGIKK